MSKLDDIFEFHFKENSIPSIRGGKLTEKSKQQIIELFCAVAVSLAEPMDNLVELQELIDEFEKL